MKSWREAINAKCKECIYDPYGGGGTWRQQVEACTSPGCPLYPLRPVSVPHEDSKPKREQPIALKRYREAQLKEKADL